MDGLRKLGVRLERVLEKAQTTRRRAERMLVQSRKSLRFDGDRTPAVRTRKLRTKTA